MDFYIQASNPVFTKEFVSEDESLSDAIESSFPMLTESVILMWNHIAIPLSYKYDISYMIDDILVLLNSLSTKQNGELVIHWLPDTFRSDWEVQWDKQVLKVYSRWECTVGHLENILNINPEISMKTDDFIYEWKKVLGIIIEGLKTCGYSVLTITDMKKLISVYSEITDNGVLYCQHF
jgi:hypothetical protein